MTKSKKVRYYSHLLTDDFATNQNRVAAVVDEHFPYERGRLSRFFSGLLLVIIRPLLQLICLVVYGVHVKNRRALRQIKGGYFIYATHTHGFTDSVSPAFIDYSKPFAIITGPKAVGHFPLSFIVPFLGGVPLNQTEQGRQHFMTYLEKLLARKAAITLMPEAHLWPYYNGIRPYKPYVFDYPIRFDVPVVGKVITFRQRRFLKMLPPKLTIHLSNPIFPDDWKSEKRPKKFVRDKIYSWMCETVEREQSFAYIEYKS